MITWDNFYLFAVASICLWLTGAIFALRSSVRSRMAVVLTIAGITCLGIFIAGLWISLQRPPLRTMGETRLWYSFFMGIAGLLTYIRWKYRWILSFSTLLSTVFVIINLLKPEIHDQSLMPALQSIWFIPHVTVYMFSYSVLGCAFIIALCGLVHHKEEYLVTADNLVYSGVAFLSIGMLLGSLWAKEAWGNYWSWDPKETWAVVTWMGYLLYIHRCADRPPGRHPEISTERLRPDERVRETKKNEGNVTFFTEESNVLRFPVLSFFPYLSMPSIQQAGGVSPSSWATVGATLARPNLPSLRAWGSSSQMMKGTGLSECAVRGCNSPFLFFCSISSALP